jgi:general stress protein 26
MLSKEALIIEGSKDFKELKELKELPKVCRLYAYSSNALYACLVA